MAGAIASTEWTRSAGWRAGRDAPAARPLGGWRRGLARFWSGLPASAPAADQSYRDGFDAGFNGETPQAVGAVTFPTAAQAASRREGYDAGRAAWLHW